MAIFTFITFEIWGRCPHKRNRNKPKVLTISVISPRTMRSQDLSFSKQFRNSSKLTPDPKTWKAAITQLQLTLIIRDIGPCKTRNKSWAAPCAGNTRQGPWPSQQSWAEVNTCELARWDATGVVSGWSSVLKIPTPKARGRMQHSRIGRDAKV